MKADGHAPRAHWEHFPHGADIGVRGVGRTTAEAFEQAALALTAVMVEPSSVADAVRVDIQCQAPDREILLTDWLNALIYEMATRHLLFGRYEVDISGDRLNARAWGEKVDAIRNGPAVEVKGATFTALKVFEDASGWWHAQCVVDV